MRSSRVNELLVPLALILLSSTLPVFGAPRLSGTSIERRATVCNGHPELCNMNFGSVCFVGAHDSYAIGTGNLAANQDQAVMTQLDDGIRMLQLQAQDKNGTIELCHTDCNLYDGGSLNDYLEKVKTWLIANPNEVLSLLIVNIQNLPVSRYDEVFKAVGLDVMSFNPPSTPLSATSWPTLGSMIDSNQRLVTFMDHQADGSVPYILDEFSNIWETSFDVTDPSFDCNINRTNPNVDPAGQMYLINHFLDQSIGPILVPFVEKLNETNAASGAGSLGAQVDTCMAQHSKPPNFMLVDFYEFGGGSVFEVAAQINNVQYNPSQPIASPSSGVTSSSTGLSSSRPLGGASSIYNIASQGTVSSLIVAVTGVVVGPYLLFL